MTNLIIHGAAGRMGRRLIALASEDPQLKVVGALEAKDHPQLGHDAGTLAGIGALGLAISADLPKEPGVVIDFTAPAATRALLPRCIQGRCPLLIGTTGLSADDHRAISDAAAMVPVLQAANMSLGVNLFFIIAGQIARQLGDDYDIEIVEAHHRFKKDAPSGTALAAAQAICEATGKKMEEALVYGRHSAPGEDATRKRGQIGMHALRMGDVVGEHTVNYAALGERLELRHVASTRDVFARGALRAAKWLGDPARKPRRYSIRDVLGI